MSANASPQNTPETNIDSDELHPIAEQAATLFEKGGGALSKDAVETLRAEVDGLADAPQLGPALASLIKVAAFLEQDRKAKKAADALLRIAVSAADALEAQNKAAKVKSEEGARKRRKQFAGFTGRQDKSVAPVFGTPGTKNAKPLHAINTPSRFQ